MNHEFQSSEFIRSKRPAEFNFEGIGPVKLFFEDSNPGRNESEFSLVLRTPNGKEIGFLTAIMVNPQTRSLFLEDKRTQENFRKKGVNRFLMGVLVEYMKQRGIDTIEGSIALTNTASFVSRADMRDPQTGKCYETTLAPATAQKLKRLLNLSSQERAEYKPYLLTVLTNIRSLVHDNGSFLALIEKLQQELP